MSKGAQLIASHTLCGSFPQRACRCWSFSPWGLIFLSQQGCFSIEGNSSFVMWVANIFFKFFFLIVGFRYNMQLNFQCLFFGLTFTVNPLGFLLQYSSGLLGCEGSPHPAPSQVGGWTWSILGFSGFPVSVTSSFLRGGVNLTRESLLLRVPW